MRTTIIGCVLMLIAFMHPTSAQASVFERLLMPGKVISGHAEFEDQCEQCHTDDDATPQSELCITCHENVGKDIRGNTGYHGLSPDARDEDCVTCHTDHEGRDAQIVSMNPNAFDHNLTDFILRGAHLLPTCDKCHEPGTQWHAASPLCIDCHQQDDEHQGSLGPQCGDCHTDVSWADTRFDHNQTGFALIGKHLQVECSACHQEEDYTAAPTECSACHAQDDVHAGVAGTRCESCHTSFAWSTTRFDHGAVSDFSLSQGHRGVPCQQCHLSADLTALDDAQCVACHRKDDVHNGKNGTQCADCHSAASWTDIRFDHQLVSDFALLGAHTTLTCESCHTESISAPIQRTCSGCHGGDSDPHKGQLGAACESCHNNDSWVQAVKFDHDLALFPLLGVHAELSCDDCHATAAFHEVDADCASCHGEEDIHQGRLGTVCSECHNPFDWERVAFNHDQTQFSLTGAHASTSCEACHREPTSDPASISQVCGDCHRRDDTHSGRFGNDCNRCHTTTSFKDIREL